MGWAYLVCVIGCRAREIVGWSLSHRCRTEDALAAVEQAALVRLPEGSRTAQNRFVCRSQNRLASSQQHDENRWERKSKQPGTAAQRTDGLVP